MSDPFFKRKRTWSQYKDDILRYYLKPYLAKVATLNKPIYLIDCFAGPGMFEDGTPGSPRIISQAIAEYGDRSGKIQAIFIERNPETYEHLLRNTASFHNFIECRQSTFENELRNVENLARHNTVFLYIDPYSVKGLVFDEMHAVYSHIHSAGMSIEMLMNFNVATFMRWALAALKRQGHDITQKALLEAENCEADYMADNPTDSIEIETLNSIAGGKEWIEIAKDNNCPFAVKLERFMRIYLNKLGDVYTHVGMYPIKESISHTVPKYALVFGSRHEDGLILMNDATSKARFDFLGAEHTGYLFDAVADQHEDNTETIQSEITTKLSNQGAMSAKELVVKIIKSHFSEFRSTSIKSVIRQFMKSGRFTSPTTTNVSDSSILELKS